VFFVSAGSGKGAGVGIVMSVAEINAFLVKNPDRGSPVTRSMSSFATVETKYSLPPQIQPDPIPRNTKTTKTPPKSTK
jgi:hypothetical protein